MGSFIRGSPTNAASQASTLEITSKIAHIAVLFRAEFPDAGVDLNPWLTDQQTQRLLDPNSIDLSFYFPKGNVGLGCACVLMQVRFSENLQLPTRRLIKIEANGFDCGKQQWQFSTEDRKFAGVSPPDTERQSRFRHLIDRIFLLFKRSNPLDSNLDFQH